MEGIKFEKVTFGSFLKSVLNNRYLKENIESIVEKQYGSVSEANMAEYIKNNIYDKIQIPVRKTAKSAGYDFIVPFELFKIPAHCKVLFPSGIKAKMPERLNLVLKLFIRSSLGIKYDLALSNGTGIIDADFYNNPENEGNICLAITNNSDSDYLIPKECRIAQGVFEEYFITEDDNATEVRVGGIGSTTK